MPSIQSLGSFAKELGVSIDYLVTGNEGVAVDTILAVRADKTLSPDMKKVIITLIENLRKPAETQQ